MARPDPQTPNLGLPLRGVGAVQLDASLKRGFALIDEAYGDHESRIAALEGAPPGGETDDSNSLDGPANAYELPYDSQSDSNSDESNVGEALDDLYERLTAAFPAKPVSGRYYNMAGPFRTEAGGAHTANQIYWQLFYVPTEMTIDQIGARVSTSVGSSNFQLAIYAVDWSIVRPTGSQIAATGNISGASATAVAGALAGGGSVTLPKGWYFLGVNSDSANAFALMSNSANSWLCGSTTIGNVSSGAGGSAFTLIQGSVNFGTWGDVTGASIVENSASRGACPILRAA